MFRRVVSSLALLCVVLGQAAPLALAHAHDGGQPAGHGARPHTHTAPPRSPHGHHQHGAGGHHHDHDDDGDSPPVPQPALPSDHDSDAAYVADALTDNRSAGGDERPLAFVWISLSFADAAMRADLRFTTPTRNRPPPGRACPLYVRHLAILI